MADVATCAAPPIDHTHLHQHAQLSQHHSPQQQGAVAESRGGHLTRRLLSLALPLRASAKRTMPPGDSPRRRWVVEVPLSTALNATDRESTAALGRCVEDAWTVVQRAVADVARQQATSQVVLVLVAVVPSSAARIPGEGDRGEEGKQGGEREGEEGFEAWVVQRVLRPLVQRATRAKVLAAFHVERAASQGGASSSRLPHQQQRVHGVCAAARHFDAERVYLPSNLFTASNSVDSAAESSAESAACQASQAAESPRAALAPPPDGRGGGGGGGGGGAAAAGSARGALGEEGGRRGWARSGSVPAAIARPRPQQPTAQGPTMRQGQGQAQRMGREAGGSGAGSAGEIASAERMRRAQEERGAVMRGDGGDRVGLGEGDGRVAGGNGGSAQWRLQNSAMPLQRRAGGGAHDGSGATRSAEREQPVPGPTLADRQSGAGNSRSGPLPAVPPAERGAAGGAGQGRRGGEGAGWIRGGTGGEQDREGGVVRQAGGAGQSAGGARSGPMQLLGAATQGWSQPGKQQLQPQQGAGHGMPSPLSSPSPAYPAFVPASHTMPIGPSPPGHAIPPSVSAPPGAPMPAPCAATAPATPPHAAQRVTGSGSGSISGRYGEENMPVNPAAAAAAGASAGVTAYHSPATTPPSLSPSPSTLTAPRSPWSLPRAPRLPAATPLPAAPPPVVKERAKGGLFQRRHLKRGGSEGCRSVLDAVAVASSARSPAVPPSAHSSSVLPISPISPHTFSASLSAAVSPIRASLSPDPSTSAGAAPGALIWGGEVFPHGAWSGGGAAGVTGEGVSEEREKGEREMAGRQLVVQVREVEKGEGGRKGPGEGEKAREVVAAAAARRWLMDELAALGVDSGEESGAGEGEEEGEGEGAREKGARERGVRSERAGETRGEPTVAHQRAVGGRGESLLLLLLLRLPSLPAPFPLPLPPFAGVSTLCAALSPPRAHPCSSAMSVPPVPFPRPHGPHLPHVSLSFPSPLLAFPPTFLSPHFPPVPSSPPSVPLQRNPSRLSRSSLSLPRHSVPLPAQVNPPAPAPAASSFSGPLRLGAANTAGSAGAASSAGQTGGGRRGATGRRGSGKGGDGDGGGGASTTLLERPPSPAPWVPRPGQSSARLARTSSSISSAARPPCAAAPGGRPGGSVGGSAGGNTGGNPGGSMGGGMGTNMGGA
ncbi:unnamed protein product [Closterium sp. Naga37s-1]|nr:unnamed protein product [Closterium sp. Naga37s-1]